jgi:hypothetical protein
VLRLDPPPEEHRDPDALIAAWGRDTPLGSDAISVRGHLWGDQTTEAAGLGINGKIDAPGGEAKLVRVANSDPGTRRPPARVVGTGLRVSGARDESGVTDAMLTTLASVRACYAAHPNLANGTGKVELTFTIQADGSVGPSSAADTGSVEPRVVSCMLGTILRLRFGAADGETTVSYTLLLVPGAPTAT